jgi:hypothetical protein
MGGVTKYIGMSSPLYQPNLATASGNVPHKEVSIGSGTLNKIMLLCDSPAIFL